MGRYLCTLARRRMLQYSYTNTRGVGGATPAPRTPGTNARTSQYCHPLHWYNEGLRSVLAHGTGTRSAPVSTGGAHTSPCQYVSTVLVPESVLCVCVLARVNLQGGARRL
eukprot:3754822-Rhodomonas_salina.1